MEEHLKTAAPQRSDCAAEKIHVLNGATAQPAAIQPVCFPDKQADMLRSRPTLCCETRQRQCAPEGRLTSFTISSDRRVQIICGSVIPGSNRYTVRPSHLPRMFSS